MRLKYIFEIYRKQEEAKISSAVINTILSFAE